MVPYTLVPVAGFTTRLGRLSFRKLNGDILLSDIDLNQGGQYGWLEWRWRELTGNRTFFAMMFFHVILSNRMLLVLLRLKAGGRRTS